MKFLPKSLVLSLYMCWIHSSKSLCSAFVPSVASPTTTKAIAIQSTTATRTKMTHFSSVTNLEENKNDSTEKDTKSNQKRVAVLICPAQFCVPADYEKIIETLKSLHNEPNKEKKEGGEEEQLPTIGTCRVAPLPRTEWIKVAKSLPTKSFLDSTLPVHTTLEWYFKAMEDALAEIYIEEGDDVNVCIIGHSIGGWVARAFLGGLSGSSTAVNRLTQQQTTSFITLGTPHSSPDDALVDQTRGLLKEVESSPSCSAQSLSDRGIDVTCVCSTGLGGNVLSTDIEELVAASSYFPLTGKGLVGGTTKGDGIIPTDLAFMEKPARKIKIESCDDTGLFVRHAHVLPTPWNLWDGSAPSISLPEEFVWYGSEGVIGQWSKYVR